jgi:hypothetical protein
MLLYNGNIHPSILIAHCVHMKETYEIMDLLLKAIIYSNNERKICGDPEVIGLLLGMQSGYTKFCCFICERDSRAKDKLHKIKDCSMRKISSRGNCVRNQPLFKKGKIFFTAATY